MSVAFDQRQAMDWGRRALTSGLRVARGLDLERPSRRGSVAGRPLVPAAVRVERTRTRGGSGKANQTAVTMWFGRGPDLPAPGLGGEALRAAVRLGAGVVGAAALAAMTAVVAQSSAERAKLRDGRETPRLVEAPGGETQL